MEIDTYFTGTLIDKTNVANVTVSIILNTHNPSSTIIHPSAGAASIDSALRYWEEALETSCAPVAERKSGVSFELVLSHHFSWQTCTYPISVMP